MPRFGPGTALIVVDVQNDFADPRGSLHVAGAEGIVPAVNAQVSLAREAGSPVLYSQDWHPEHTPHFAVDGGAWPVHCVADSWGAKLYPALDVALGAPLIRKGADGEDGYSAFTMRDPETGDSTPTRLALLLHEARVERVVVVGLATDYCVRATALDAVRLGYRATVLTDAVAAVDLAPGDGERALAEMRQAGVVLAAGSAE